MANLDWDFNPEETLVQHVDDVRANCLDVYRSDTNRIDEDARREASISEGGYGRKQIQELLQNGADALGAAKGTLEVRLTEDTLYVANQGDPFTLEGVDGLLYSHFSTKTGEEIGRFGLGFKSISGISDSPQIYSRSVSFQFDRNRAQQTIEEDLGVRLDIEDVPALRLAWPVDPMDEFEVDSELRELAQWATTIIKVPLKPGARSQLLEELDSFDESFCLFVPHVKTLRLRSLSNNIDRTITSKRSGKSTFLTIDGEGSSRWLVFNREHRPSVEALESAGHSARRDSITVSWAVPLDGRPGVGHLAAYFPVKSEVTLSGILNAPWKLSDDRINVIEGAFNKEILEKVVPELVNDAKHDLVRETGPGRYLDVLPARGREERSWADGIINNPIYQRLRGEHNRSLPNIAGELRSPNSLWLIPSFITKRFTTEASQNWASKVIDTDAWAHPDSVSNAERRAKSERLQGIDSKDHVDIQLFKWLEAVVDTDSAEPHQSINAIEFATMALHEDPTGAYEQIQKSKIILLESGRWIEPAVGRCFIGSPDEPTTPAVIHHEVTAHPEARNALAALGITEYSNSGELFAILREIRRNPHVNWDMVWSALRSSQLERVREGFREILDGKQQKVVKIKTADGKWSNVDGQYMPEQLLHPSSKDASLLVNNRYHASDAEILELLGVYGSPTVGTYAFKEKWFREYRKEIDPIVGKELSAVPKRAWDKFEYRVATLRGPLEILRHLSSANNARLTDFLLKNELSPDVEVSHPNTKQRTRVIHPVYWLIKKYGMLKTTFGEIPVGKCFVLGEDDQQVSDIVPAVIGLEVSEKACRFLGFHRSIEQYTGQGFAKLVAFHVTRDDEDAVGKAYSWWAYKYPDEPPAKMQVRTHGGWSYLSPHQIAVTTDENKESLFEDLGIPSLPVPSTDDIQILAEWWGLMKEDQIPVHYRADKIGEPEDLLFTYRPLEDFSDERDDLDEFVIQPAASLEMVTAITGQPERRRDVEFGLEKNVIFVTATDPRERLSQVLRTLELPHSDEDVEIILEQIEVRKNHALRAKIVKAESAAERLLLTVGSERLTSLIPEAAVDYLEADGTGLPEGIELAELCIKMYGPSALEEACKRNPESLSVGTVPTLWNGSYKAREWVRELSFSDEWAGQKSAPRKSNSESIDGPTSPGEFHPYQKKVSEQLHGMLVGNGPRRGLITLPTGAGKTRVAVQTIIQTITEGSLDKSDDDQFTGPILWIVDTAELGEQAIDSWSFLWRAFGRQNTQLILSRHYGGFTAQEETGAVQVVVASFQTLVNAIYNSEYDWLKATPLVIIDEAHRAAAQSYTKILNWTGRTTTQRDGLLLGLSATPFRGTADSDETKRLQSRFDNNFLDEGVFGNEPPMVYLQNRQVLSRVTMEIIKNNKQIRLTDSQKNDFREKHWLSKSIEQQIGQDTLRTQRILESIKSMPSDWPILVFAASVDNAQALAALLSLDGIPATAITDKTSPAERKLAIKRFRSGDLRVLTNYAVLSQGFDAPKTRAVYITRPTSSEVRYQQMIGRGLRGPRNGGTADVHIVNVLDNLESFDLSIEYRRFEGLADHVEEYD